MGNHNTNLNARANINDRIRLIGIAYEASNLIFPSIEEETNRLRLSVWRWFNDNKSVRHRVMVALYIWFESESICIESKREINRNSNVDILYQRIQTIFLDTRNERLHFRQQRWLIFYIWAIFSNVIITQMLNNFNPCYAHHRLRKIHFWNILTR